MKEIRLTRGKVALVDDEDFEELNKFKWYAKQSTNTFYAARSLWCNGKHAGNVLMHTQILCKNLCKNQIDHSDQNGLNNQKFNLRFCSNSENLANKNKRKNCTSIYKGVSFCKERGNFESKIGFMSKTIHLGRFKSEIDAAIAYNNAATDYFGEFALLNVIPDLY